MRTFKFFLLFVVSFNLCAMAGAGTKDGGGGSDIEQEFVISARVALNYLRKYAEKLKWIDFSKLNADIAQLKVHETNSTLYGDDGNEKVAVNFAETKEVYVNKPRWTAIKSGKRKLALALHELLSLENYEATGDYRVSSWLFSMSQAEIEKGVVVVTKIFKAIGQGLCGLGQDVARCQEQAKKAAIERATYDCKMQFPKCEFLASTNLETTYLREHPDTHEIILKSPFVQVEVAVKGSSE